MLRLALLELQSGIADRTETSPRILLETPAQESRDRRRQVCGQLVPSRIVFQHTCQRDRDVIAVECAAAGQHLVEDDAEGPDIGAAIDDLAARLLGRHVCGGAKDDAHLRCVNGERRRIHHVDGAAAL
jgi:hypothetical protein